MTGGAQVRTLLLSQSYEPIKLISWQRALTLLTLGKVEVVREYCLTGWTKAADHQCWLDTAPAREIAIWMNEVANERHRLGLT